MDPYGQVSSDDGQVFDIPSPEAYAAQAQQQPQAVGMSPQEPQEVVASPVAPPLRSRLSAGALAIVGTAGLMLGVALTKALSKKSGGYRRRYEDDDED